MVPLLATKNQPVLLFWVGWGQERLLTDHQLWVCGTITSGEKSDDTDSFILCYELFILKLIILDWNVVFLEYLYTDHISVVYTPYDCLILCHVHNFIEKIYFNVLL